jgi:hypothetical protein
VAVDKPTSITAINNTSRALARKRPRDKKPHLPPSAALGPTRPLRARVYAAWILDHLTAGVGIEVNPGQVGKPQLDTICVVA